MSEPFLLSDSLRLYPPNVALVGDGVSPREAAQWSVQENGRARPLSLGDAVELTEDEYRLEFVRAHIQAIAQANELIGLHLATLAEDVDQHADDVVIPLVKLGQFVEQATHDLAHAPIGMPVV
jgi:hypothetical protein